MRLPLPVAVLTLTASASLSAQQPAKPAHPTPHPATASTLPVTSVSLYKNGVGFFEHTGNVTGNGAVTIDFTSAQLNDVLQSLTAVDLGGGRIAGAGYNSATPLDQQLRTLPFTLSDDSSATDFYAAIRGARVEVHAPGGSITGRLLSIETRTTNAGDDAKPAAERRYLTVVSDSGEVRTLELTSATSVRLLDPALQQSVGRYLQLVESNRSQGLRHLTLQDNGTGTREVRVSYISEVPVWKSTYRILFTPSSSGSTTTLQGWSVVDNTTGADWVNVHLSLIAGAPQSFIQPLSQPIYTRRPEIPIATEAQLTPQTFDSSMEPNTSPKSVMADAPPPPVPTIMTRRALSSAGVAGMSGMAGGASRGIIGGMPGAAGGPLAQNDRFSGGGFEALYENAAASSITPNSSASAFDDYFAYTLDNPVTILKNQSALVPILQTKIPAESVTLVSYANGRISQPLRALWLTNASGLTLDRGSFTVIESGNFAGEGLLDPVHANEKRLVSYAADQAVHVTTEGDKTTNHVTLIRGSKGVLNIHRADIHEMTLVFHNAASTQRSVVSEVPVVKDWELDSNPKPVETTATVYRFRTEVDPGATVRLHVGAKHSGFNTYYLTNTNDSQIQFMLSQTNNNAALKAALEPVLEARRKVSYAQDRVNEINTKLTDLRNDEDRQRANVVALASADHTARDRFVNDLNKTEDAIHAAQAELTLRQKALEDAKSDLANKIESVQLDEAVS